MTGFKEYSPIEVTTHNLYFHDEASIFTIHSNERFVATGGGDKDIRLWIITKDSPKDKEFCYTTAVNTSVRVAYHSVLSGHQRGVNCVRFNGDLLASCSDGGEVIVWDNSIPNVIRRLDGDDAYELVWGGEHLFVGFASGNITVFKIVLDEEPVVSRDVSSGVGVEADENLSNSESPNVKDNQRNTLRSANSIKGSVELYMEETTTEEIEGGSRRISAIPVQRIKCHNDIIQGLAFNQHFNLLTSLSKDRTGKTFVFTNKLTQIERMEYLGKDKLFTAGRGFFRRLSYSSDGNFLYLVCCHSNTVVVLHYPFRIEHVYAKIGPLNSEPLKVISAGERLFVVTKKSLYLFINQELVFCVDNISFMAVTDGCMVEDVCFLSSLDGFLASLRIKERSEDFVSKGYDVI